MSMKNMEELKEMLCDELDAIVKKGEVSMGDLDVVDKITNSMKNIDKIIMADRYSYRGSYGDYDDGRTYDGGMNGGRSYTGDGSSYASRSRHYVRGHYSYGDEGAMIGEKLEEMMNDGRMDSNDKRILRQALDIIRK